MIPTVSPSREVPDDGCASANMPDGSAAGITSCNASSTICQGATPSFAGAHGPIRGRSAMVARKLDCPIRGKKAFINRPAGTSDHYRRCASVRSRMACAVICWMAGHGDLLKKSYPMSKGTSGLQFAVAELTNRGPGDSLPPRQHFDGRHITWFGSQRCAWNVDYRLRSGQMTANC